MIADNPVRRAKTAKALLAKFYALRHRPMGEQPGFNDNWNIHVLGITLAEFDTIRMVHSHTFGMGFTGQERLTPADIAHIDFASLPIR